VKKGNRKQPPRASSQRPEQRSKWGYKAIESGKDARLEDQIRVRDMLRAIQSSDDPCFRRKAFDLMRRLEAIKNRDFFGETLASKVLMRTVRKLWVRHVKKAVQASKGLPISFVTLLPKSFELRDEELEDFDPAAANNALRSLLNRRGIAKRRGWVIGALHGEFDSIKKLWRIHWHLLVCGGMISVIDVLRNHADYASRKGQAPRVRMSRKPITNVRRVASYLLQAWWPNRPTGKFGRQDGECR
jgi:hypothetical protein